MTATEPPASIARMTYNLTTAIKLAVPTPTTLSLIEGNAKYWAQNMAIILRDHYEDSIKNDMQILTQLGGEIAQNFDIASAWARHHFGRRLKQITLDDIWAILRHESCGGNTDPIGSFHTTRRTITVNSSSQTGNTGRNPAAVQISDEITPLPIPRDQAPRRTYSQVVSVHTNIQRTPPTQARHPPGGHSPATATVSCRTIMAQVHDPPRKPQLVTTATMTTQWGGDWSPELPDPQFLAREERSAGTSRRATPPSTWYSWTSISRTTTSKPKDSTEEELILNFAPDDQRSATTMGQQFTISAQVHDPPRKSSISTKRGGEWSPVIPIIQLPPREHRATRSFRPATPSFTKDPQQPLPSPAMDPEPAGEMESEPLITGGKELVMERPRSSGSMTTTPSNGHQSGGHTKPTSKLMADLVQSQLQLGKHQAKSPQDTTQIPTRRPTRHINTKRKMVEWSLKARNKWLIIGDSNLARFPPFQHQDVQVASFPGATFRHAEAILAKTDVSPMFKR